MRICFIVSPIGNESTEIRNRADKLFKFIVKPVCEKCNFEAVRVDQLNNSDSITNTIIEQLSSAELVIADITGHNPNVFYEMGYRACLKKPIIHLRMKGEQIPFDIASIRTFDYDFELEHVEEIKDRLVQTINSFSIEERDNESEETTIAENSNSGIASMLQILYSIQDSISDLCEEIKAKDTETLQAMMKTSLDNASANVDSIDTAMIKILLPELLKNPQSLKNLMDMANISKNKEEDK